MRRSHPVNKCLWGSVRRICPGANVIGVALTEVREDVSDRCYYYGYYGK
jgi:hypothetical protein